MTDLRALSIARPWAALILHAGKQVENRTWPTGYRGPLVIHASRRWDRWAAELAAACGLPATPSGHPCGYLGVVDLVDVHHATTHPDRSCSRWAEPDAWHWVLADPQVFAEPIPAPGRLGLYPPPPAALAALAGGRPA